MTEQTGTVKSFALLKTKMIVTNINRNGPGGVTMVELRPEWDENIREHQLAIESLGKRNASFTVPVPAESASFFEPDKPYFLEITRAG
jgi:hypothetical protein